MSELVRDLQSKHLAEKQLLECDIKAYRQIVKRLVAKFKHLYKQKQK